MTDEEPTRWLNYKGDRRTMRNVVGPDTAGALLTPVEAEYDPETDMTRVGFVVGGRPDLRLVK
jgi:hypothetical protein